MQPEPPPSPDMPAWLPWAAAVAVAAFLAALGAMLRRVWRGEPVVAARPHGDVPWQGGDVLVVVLGGIAAAQVVGSWIGDDPSLEVRLAGGMLVMSAAAMIAIGWLVCRGATAIDLGFVEGCLGSDIRLAGAGLALVLAPLLAVAALLDGLVPYEHPVVTFLAARRDPWAVGLVLATALLAAPLTEELLFRRVLQGWLEKRLPGVDGAAAIAISAATFALAHVGQGLAYVPLFPLGLVLGFIARRTGSIVPCILLHTLFNGVSVTLLLAGPTPPVAPPS